MNTTMPKASELTHRAEAAMRGINDRVRSAPQRGRELLHSRRHNALLRELGQLYYDAYLDETDVDASERDRILADLDHIDIDQAITTAGDDDN